MSQLDTPSKPVPRRGLRLTGIAAVVAAAIVAHGLAVRASESSRLRDWAEAQALPTVAVSPPAAVANAAGIELPGRIEAWQRAPIYARVSGYLKGWKHDIGSHVKAGEVLADIETPDLDQQLAQARADLATAQANAALALAGGQRAVGHDADATRRRQSRWRPAAGRLRRRTPQCEEPSRRAQRARQRTDHQRQRCGGRHRGRGRQGRRQAGDDSARPRSDGRDGSGLDVDDRIIENPPDGVVTGTQVRIAGAARKSRIAATVQGKNPGG